MINSAVIRGPSEKKNREELHFQTGMHYNKTHSSPGQRLKGQHKNQEQSEPETQNVLLSLGYPCSYRQLRVDLKGKEAKKPECPQ